MGKRRVKRYKIIGKENNDEVETKNNLDNDDLNDENNKTKIKIDLKIILDIINSNNLIEILKLSSFLSNYNYEILYQEQDKREKEIFVLISHDFLFPYLNILLTMKTSGEKEEKIK